ncbi:MAG: hypothetical protein HQK53_12050 [Oligoflexia bacterium]|nr:hypothetical protein [Oligoflexia bacterium]
MKNILRLFLILIFNYCITQPLIAEYRVYQYYIFSNSQNGAATAAAVAATTNAAPPAPASETPLPQKSSELITSTLDPVSYVAYHGGQSSISVSLLRTWICPGYTDEPEYCPSPYKQLIDSTKKQQEKAK